jgi:malate dehydrogenase
VVGNGPAAVEAARGLAAHGSAEVLISVATRGAARAAEEALGGAVRAIVGLDDGAPADVLMVTADCHGAFSSGGAAGSAALWAARNCPDAAIILLAGDGAGACREAARRSGLPSWLILAPGGMPLAATERGRLARVLGVDASQIAVPVIGGAKTGWRPLRRYATIAGIPLSEPCLASLSAHTESGEGPGPPEILLVSSAVMLARAVLQDRRQVLSCCAWVEGFFGIAGAFVSVPVRVGARGAEEPLQMRLSLEERALLQHAASV